MTPDPAQAAPADRPGRPRPAAGYAVLLGALALMWGSSYLFIKIGVETLPPLSLVLLRLLVGLAILLVVVAVTRTPLPRDRRTIAHFAVLGAVNVAIPFWLIGWAAQHIASGLTGVLQSTAPFFTLVLAATFVHDERITAGRLAGIGLGFLGIVLLSAENLFDVGSPLGAERLLAELAVVGSSLAYGIGNTYARRNLRAARPLVLATGQVASGTLLVGLLALVVDGGVTLPAVPEAAFSVLWLGAIGTGLAYLVFFRLLTGWGPTRASLVAYLMPVVALILGVAVLGETIDAQLVAGAALIVAGVWVVNRNG
ncbi:MAG TPA: DMT family transporter [Patescibacteria group bacterium]|nr:DMT family transporter [Patescibacteria group bacterium]